MFELAVNIEFICRLCLPVCKLVPLKKLWRFTISQGFFFLFLPPEQLWEMFVQLKLQSAQHYLSTLSKRDSSWCSLKNKKKSSFSGNPAHYSFTPYVYTSPGPALVHLKASPLNKLVPVKSVRMMCFPTQFPLTQTWVCCLSWTQCWIWRCCWCDMMSHVRNHCLIEGIAVWWHTKTQKSEALPSGWDGKTYRGESGWDEPTHTQCSV